MQELFQILKQEQTEKEKIEEARKEVQAEIEKKRQELIDKLNSASFLSEEERVEILEGKRKEIEKIKKSLNCQLEADLKALEEKQQANFQKAVGYVVEQVRNF